MPRHCGNVGTHRAATVVVLRRHGGLDGCQLLPNHLPEARNGCVALGFHKARRRLPVYFLTYQRPYRLAQVTTDNSTHVIRGGLET